jgi:dephospho-CoA kinase
MLFVGLTGGIGSGKSTAARMLSDLGAVVLDADALAREVTAASSPRFREIVGLFGPEILAPDGELDRAAVAAIVFSDPEKLDALERIVHPVVDERIEEGLARYAGTDTVLVLDSPLLIQMGMAARCDLVVVVACSPERQVSRLLAKGMEEADARARMAAQPSLDEIASHADHVLDNDGSVAELEDQVRRLWSDLERRRDDQSGTPV